MAQKQLSGLVHTACESPQLCLDCDGPQPVIQPGQEFFIWLFSDGTAWVRCEFCHVKKTMELLQRGNG